MIRRIPIAAAVVTLLAAAPAAGQDWFRPTLSDMTKCPGGFAKADKAKLSECVDQLAEDVGAPATGDSKPRIMALPDEGASQTREQAAESDHMRLLQYYAAYLAAKREAGRMDEATRPRIMDIGDSLHAALREHELEETSPLVGELRAGSALTDTGNFTGTAAASTDNSKTNPLAHIVWSTTHANALDKESGGDISFSGRVGLEPAMTALKLTSGTLNAKYQQALVVGAGLDLNRFSGRTESSVVVRGGFVRLGELAQVVEHNGSSELALPAGPEGKVAPYLEVGGKFNLFDRQMALVHLSHAELSSRLSSEFVYRLDARFDDLSNLGQGIEAPSGKFLVWRLMVDGLQIVDKRTEPAGNKVFTASFGFEYRYAKNTPYGFAFLIRGDIDLLKALSPGHVEQ